MEEKNRRTCVLASNWCRCCFTCKRFIVNSSGKNIDSFHCTINTLFLSFSLSQSLWSSVKRCDSVWHSLWRYIPLIVCDINQTENGVEPKNNSSTGLHDVSIRCGRFFWRLRSLLWSSVQLDSWASCPILNITRKLSPSRFFILGQRGRRRRILPAWIESAHLISYSTQCPLSTKNAILKQMLCI